MFTTLVTFIFVLFVLVMVHEAGHFFAARRFGVRVFEFGFGIPPRIFGWRRKTKDRGGVGLTSAPDIGQTQDLLRRSGGRYEFIRGNQEPTPSERTLFSLNWLPIGGFVKIKGENEESPDADSFSRQKAGKRILILSAGVMGNILLAFVVFIVLFSLPSEIYVPEGVSLAGARVQNERIIITMVTPGSPAERAGIKEGDILVSLDGNTFTDIAKVREYIQSHGDRPMTIELVRGGGAEFASAQSGQTQGLSQQVLAQPEMIAGSDKPLLGIGMVRSVEVSYPIPRAVIKAGETVVVGFFQVAKGLASVVMNLARGEEAGVDISGPVGIAAMTGQAARRGFWSLLQFMAVLSLNLAFINIIPFPALDGGRILFILIEKMRGKKIKGSIEQVVNTVGFSLLLLLILFVSVKDVGKLGFVQKIFEGVRLMF